MCRDPSRLPSRKAAAPIGLLHLIAGPTINPSYPPSVQYRHSLGDVRSRTVAVTVARTTRGLDEPSRNHQQIARVLVQHQRFNGRGPSSARLIPAAFVVIFLSVGRPYTLQHHSSVWSSHV